MKKKRLLWLFLISLTIICCRHNNIEKNEKKSITTSNVINDICFQHYFPTIDDKIKKVENAFYDLYLNYAEVNDYHYQQLLITLDKIEKQTNEILNIDNLINEKKNKYFLKIINDLKTLKEKIICQQKESQKMFTLMFGEKILIIIQTFFFFIAIWQIIIKISLFQKQQQRKHSILKLKEKTKSNDNLNDEERENLEKESKKLEEEINKENKDKNVEYVEQEKSDIEAIKQEDIKIEIGKSEDEKKKNNYHKILLLFLIYWQNIYFFLTPFSDYFYNYFSLLTWIDWQKIVYQHEKFFLPQIMAQHVIYNQHFFLIVDEKRYYYVPNIKDFHGIWYYNNLSLLFLLCEHLFFLHEFNINEDKKPLLITMLFFFLKLSLYIHRYVNGERELITLNLCQRLLGYYFYSVQKLKSWLMIR